MKKRNIISVGAVLVSASILAFFGCFLLNDPRFEVEEETDFSNQMSFISSVDGVGWSWDPPESMHISGVHPTAVGLLVSHRHGLVSLHGETSEEIWSYESKGDFSTSVTADGLGVLLLAEEEGIVVFLDALTGDTVSEYSAPEGVFLHPSLVTTGQLLIPSSGGLSSYEIKTGDLSWRYEGKRKCFPLPIFNQDEPWNWPVSTNADALFLPEVCPAGEADDAGLYEELFSVGVIAIDGVSGDTLWESEKIPMDADDVSGEGFPPVWLAVADDARAIRLDVSGENYMFDIVTGDLLEGEWPLTGDDGFYNDLRVYVGSSWNIWYQRESSSSGHHDYVKTSYDGRIFQEVQIPEEVHVQVDHLWEPVNRAVALEDGVLTYGCAFDCKDSFSGTMNLIFAPWDDDFLEIEVEQLDPEINNAHVRSRLLVVPGAVVAYQENQNGKVLGSLVGLT